MFAVSEEDSESAIWSFDFSDLGNEVIKHGSTGLMWQKEDDNIKKTWESALVYCEGLLLGGYDDWRLPNIIELHTITDYSTYAPTIDQTYFPNTASGGYGYWSSTTKASNTAYAWYVTFDKGDVDNYAKTSAYYIRCTRNGQ